MEKNGLLLSVGEKVAKRYDFVEGTDENSLVITNDRVIRRVNGGDTFSQNEIRIADVNRISTVCQTKHYYSEPKTDPKKYLFIFIAILLLGAVGYCIYWIVKGGGRNAMIAGGASLLLSIIFFIIAFKLKKKSKHTQEIILTINLYERFCNECVINIERVCGSPEVARELANEIGSILLCDPTGDEADFDAEDVAVDQSFDIPAEEGGVAEAESAVYSVEDPVDVPEEVPVSEETPTAESSEE